MVFASENGDFELFMSLLVLPVAEVRNEIFPKEEQIFKSFFWENKRTYSLTEAQNLDESCIANRW